MIKLKVILLLTIGLLAPLHGAGEAPAHSGAGGEDSAPVASTRRGTPSSATDNVFALCQATQRRLHEQFPVLTTDTAEAIGSERLFITGEQLDALTAVAEVLQTALARPAKKAALDACDTLANDAKKAIQSVLLTDTSNDAMKLKQVIAEYHKAQKLRATGPKAVPAIANPFKLSSSLLRTMTSFLDAPDLAPLAATNSQQNIQSRLLSPDGAVLTKTETMLCAQFIFKNHEQPNSEENYSISLPCAMQRLTKATATENAADIEKWNKIVTKLIDERHAPFRIAFEVAKAKLEAITAPDLLSHARGLLAEMAKDDLLNRMALCFAWFIRFRDAENLDTNIKLSSIIERYNIDDFMVYFSSIKELPRREAITQLIIDFVLSVIKPIVLRIGSPFGAVTVVSNQLIYLRIYNYRDTLHTLNALDVYNCPELISLFINVDIDATALDFSNLPKLKTLYWNRGRLLTTLNISNCPQLEELKLFNKPRLTTLNLSNLPQLQNLYFSECPLLTELDLSKCTLLEIFYAGSNSGLTALDLSNCTLLKTLYAPPVATLDLSNCSQLYNLKACDNPWLTTLDLSNHPQLAWVDVRNNPRLTTLDLSNCTNLNRLKVDKSNKRLTDVTLENTPRLWSGERKHLEDLVADNRARIRE